MRAADQLAAVIGLACETEDRTPDEQRALFAVALRVDRDRAKYTLTNLVPHRPHLAALVVESYQPADDQRRANLSAADRRALERLDTDWAKARAQVARGHA